MSNPEMKTILKDLREYIAKDIEFKFMPLHVCEVCCNEAEGYLVQRIIDAIRDED